MGKILGNWEKLMKKTEKIQKRNCKRTRKVLERNWKIAAR